MGTHPMIRSDEVLRVAPAGSRWLDRATFAERYPNRAHRACDVLVTLSPVAGHSWIMRDTPSRSSRCESDHRVPLPPEDEAALPDGLLAEIEARRQIAQREIDVLDDVSGRHRRPDRWDTVP
jgi:hypothetical protein